MVVTVWTREVSLYTVLCLHCCCVDRLLLQQSLRQAVLLLKQAEAVLWTCL